MKITPSETTEITLDQSQPPETFEFKVPLEAQVEKALPPKFVTPLREIEVVEGESATFLANVSGKPLLEILWFKDDKPLGKHERIEREETPDGSVRLTINKTVLEDEGNYKCVARNGFGEVTSSSNLFVEEKIEKPFFLERLKDLEVLEGSDVKLEVRLKENDLEVDWYKNEEIISEETIRTEFVENEERGTFSFVIHSTEPEDQGLYKCVAANDAGEVSCQGELKVRVHTQAPQFLQRLESMDVVESSDINLEVEVIGKPKPTVKWLKDGKPIQCNERVMMESEGRIHTLMIQGVKLDDEAEYKCLARNSAGETYCTAMLLLEEEMKAPEFVKLPENVEINEGGTARFEAVVAGIPEPEIEWLKDDKPIKEDHRIKLRFDNNRSVLRVLEAELTDEGDYTCIASNKVGKCSCTIELIVEEASIPPTFIKRLSPVELFEGELARLEVRVSGTPEPEVTWSKNEEFLEEGERCEVLSDDDMHYLTIQDCFLSDSGCYKCTAVNEAGKVSCSTELKVMEKPESLQFSDKDMPYHVDEAGNITLEATVTGRPRPKVEWQKNNTPITPSSHYDVQVDGDQYRLTIVAAIPGDSGTYKCEASNEFDTVSRTFNIDIEGRTIPYFYIAVHST